MPKCEEIKDMSQAPHAILPFATQTVAILLAKSNTANMPDKYGRLYKLVSLKSAVSGIGHRIHTTKEKTCFELQQKQ